MRGIFLSPHLSNDYTSHFVVGMTTWLSTCVVGMFPSLSLVNRSLIGLRLATEWAMVRDDMRSGGHDLSPERTSEWTMEDITPKQHPL